MVFVGMVLVYVSAHYVVGATYRVVGAHFGAAPPGDLDFLSIFGNFLTKTSESGPFPQ